jgi:hypothetical protein
MEKRAILQAMSHMSSRTCINFRPTKGEKGHLRVYKRLPGDTTGWSKLCGAELGYAGDKPHILVLGEPDCFPQGRILHELMHVAGFPHEHSRPDRDKYIKIIWRNLLQESLEDKLNFRTFNGRYAKAGPYDYYSLLHYGLYTQSVNDNAKTIVPTRPVNEDKVGQRDGFTATDVAKLNNFYGCPRRGFFRSRKKGALHDFFQDAVQNARLERMMEETLRSEAFMGDPSEKDDLGHEFWKTFDVKLLW